MEDLEVTGITSHLKGTPLESNSLISWGMVVYLLAELAEHLATEQERGAKKK